MRFFHVVKAIGGLCHGTPCLSRFLLLLFHMALTAFGEGVRGSQSERRSNGLLDLTFYKIGIFQVVNVGYSHVVDSNARESVITSKGIRKKTSVQ